MRNIPSLLLLFCTVFISSFCCGQERQNGKPYAFEQRSDSITSAMLWWYKNNVWDSFPKPADPVHPEGYNNLQLLRTVTMTYGGKKYYVIIHRKLDVRFEPKTKYRYFETVTYFTVYDQVQYARLKAALDQKTNQNVFITSRHGGEVFGGYSEFEVYKSVIQDMPRPGDYDEWYFPINVQTLKGKDIVRFVPPRNPMMNFSETPAQMQRRKRKELPIVDNEMLKTYYYELPLSEFRKILID
jgi:hypothetical protein